MSFPTITDLIIQDIKPNSNTTINEKRIETINHLTKACFGYFGTAPKNISEQWESNCFLLDGKWGSGKSWTLDVIEAWIKDKEFSKIKYPHKNKSGEDLEKIIVNGKNIQFLKFSAWQYLDEKELFFDLYELVQEDFESIVDKYVKFIESKQNFIDGTFTDNKEIQEQVKNETQEFYEQVGNYSNQIVKLSKSGLKVVDSISTTYKKTNELIEKVITFTDKSIWLKSLVNETPIAKTIYGSLSQHYKNTKNEKRPKDERESLDKINTSVGNLNETLKELVKSNQDKFSKISSVNIHKNKLKTSNRIIVIDDLDRVHEDKLWRILTLLSLFDKQANLVFICVGSSEYLIKILEAKYHVNGEGENFLTKFFAREFQLKQDSYLELLVNEFVLKEEWTEVLEFLNLFVDIPTYREYKTRYLQPLKEMKEDTTKNVNSVEFIITQFLQIKYANILHLLKSKNYSDLKSEIEKIIDSKNEKVQNLGLIITSILTSMNSSIMLKYISWKENKPKELQTGSSTVHNINIGLKKYAIDDGYVLEFLYSMNFRRINYDLNFGYVDFLKYPILQEQLESLVVDNQQYQ